jgi:hypothetical protein
MKIFYPDNWILNRLGRELEGLEGEGTYFVNYALYDETQPRPHGAWFTHLEPAWKKKFDEVADKVDYAVCQNETIKRYLEDKGVPTTVIYPGHDPRVKKKPIFGYCGREYKSGRKATELLPKGTIKFGYEEAPEIYKKIDYLIITARIEGGPVPLTDAIAAGVPVIARGGVGNVNEFPCVRYKDDREFKKIINQLTNPPTWKQWRKKHQSLFCSKK